MPPKLDPDPEAGPDSDSENGDGEENEDEDEDDDSDDDGRLPEPHRRRLPFDREHGWMYGAKQNASWNSLRHTSTS